MRIGGFFCQTAPCPRSGEGDFLALLSAGAYGFVMASNYNGHPLAAEILVDGAKAAVVRRRQRPDRDLGRTKQSPRGFLL